MSRRSTLTTALVSGTLAAGVALGVSTVLPAGATPAAAPATAVAAPALAVAAPAAQGNHRTPEVTVIGTGGTIAGLAESRDALQTYRAGQVPIADLVGALQPELSGVAEVETVQFGNAGSSGYTIEQFRELTLAVDEALKTSDGVVVTTGTDTMEEFAYWLDLTVRSDKPVVLTGAMRPSNVIGADGPANLFNAIRLAGSGETTCYGAVIMLNDEFYAAREVTKTDALRLDTFDGGQFGALGVIDEERVTTRRAPARAEQCGTASWSTPFDVSTIGAADLPRVEIAYSYQEAGGEAISAFAAAGVEGIVTAGTGAGGISPAMREARTAALEQGVLFGTTTRTGSGSIYDAEEPTPGVIGMEDLLPQKARLLLMLSLAFSEDEAQVREWVDTIGSPEFS
ncbi:asparaginase [Kineococcus arenarius]|uniref:asparaginase n=1 Tax=Kineococcus sp. SYSU DK007 TaxID=3383128 RepID=UPI003D7E5375